MGWNHYVGLNLLTLVCFGGHSVSMYLLTPVHSRYACCVICMCPLCPCVCVVCVCSVMCCAVVRLLCVSCAPVLSACHLLLCACCASIVRLCCCAPVLSACHLLLCAYTQYCWSYSPLVPPLCCMQQTVFCISTHLLVRLSTYVVQHF